MSQKEASFALHVCEYFAGGLPSTGWILMKYFVFDPVVLKILPKNDLLVVRETRKLGTKSFVKTLYIYSYVSASLISHCMKLIKKERNVYLFARFNH